MCTVVCSVFAVTDFTLFKSHLYGKVLIIQKKILSETEDQEKALPYGSNKLSKMGRKQPSSSALSVY